MPITETSFAKDKELIYWAPKSKLTGYPSPQSAFPRIGLGTIMG
jgi:hypothetical protein